MLWKTFECIHCRTVPVQIPGIVFLSGGQTEEEATVNLNAINLYAQQQHHEVWSLTFSFGGGLQLCAACFWIVFLVTTSSSKRETDLAKPTGQQNCVSSAQESLVDVHITWLYMKPYVVDSSHMAQASVMSIWSKDQSNQAEAKAMAAALASVNGTACQGKYQPPHPSILQESLHESFRGWNSAVKSA